MRRQARVSRPRAPAPAPAPRASDGGAAVARTSVQVDDEVIDDEDEPEPSMKLDKMDVVIELLVQIKELLKGQYTFSNLERL